jgi:hypothetical protein
VAVIGKLHVIYLLIVCQDATGCHRWLRLRKILPAHSVPPGLTRRACRDDWAD